MRLKTTFLSKMLLLVAVVLMGAGNAWGDTVTFDATTDITSNAASYQSTEITINANDGSTWKANGYGATENTNIVIGKGGANYLETPAVNGTITSVAVTWSGNTSYYLALQTTSGTELEAKSNPSTSTTETFSVSGSYSQLRLVGRRSSGTSNAAATITKVVVTYSTGSTPTPTYTVTYNANGGTGSMTENNTYEEGDEVTLQTNSFTAPDGMLWDSWSVKDASNNTVTVSNGKFTMPASNVTVTAQWVTDPSAPQYEWVETGLADLTSSDVFVIVGTVSSQHYSMANDGTSNPVASVVTIANNKITSAVSNNIKWNISGNSTDGYTFYPNGNSEKWLYCNTTSNSGSNTNLRVGTGDRKIFVANGTTLKTKDNYTDRYWNVYSTTPDWRGYASNSTSTTVSFYKRQLVSTDPSISADNVNIAYNATNGSIAFTVTNPVDGGQVSATTEANWLTPGSATGTSPISFTCSANSETTARTATVTLTYTYNTNETVTTNVTVTQAAAPVVYTTIPALFEAATGSATNVLVTFNNWVVSGVSTDGKSVFLSDNNGNGFVIFDNNGGLNNTYAVGNILSGTAVTCNLVKYNGFAELTSLDANDLSITTGGTVSTSNIAMADLSGVHTGALVSYQNLTCSVNNNKYYLSDGTTTLQVYNALYVFEALEAGKAYNITGVYQQYGNTKEILPRSAADIEEVVVTTPSITLASNSIEVTAASGDNGTIDITYANLTINNMNDFGVQFYDSEDNELSAAPSWLEVLVAEQDPQVGEGYVVSYSTREANDGAARSAYFKIYVGQTYSNLVTVTQAAYVAPPTPGNWVLTNLADLTSSDIFVIVGTLNNETYALPNDGGTNTPAVEAVTVANNTLSGEIAANLQWNLSGNATDGYTFYPNGDDESWLYCSTTANSGSNSNMKVGTGDRKVFVQENDGFLVTNDNYVDRYLSIYVNSGTAQDWRGYINTNSAPTISFYKKVSTTTATITLNAACHDNSGMVYGTYSNSSAFVVSDDIVVAEVGIDSENKLVVRAYDTGDIVPANTGVMVSALEGGNYTVTLSSEAGSSVLGSSNRLRPTGNGITNTEMSAADANCLFYRLTMHNGTQIGFYWGAAEGDAFDLGANKAYLAVPKSTGARLEGLWFGDDATAIENVNHNNTLNGEAYDLQGRRVVAPQKGLYIVNGRKVVVK